MMDDVIVIDAVCLANICLCHRFVDKLSHERTFASPFWAN